MNETETWVCGVCVPAGVRRLLYCQVPQGACQGPDPSEHLTGMALFHLTNALCKTCNPESNAPVEEILCGTGRPWTHAKPSPRGLLVSLSICPMCI